MLHGARIPNTDGRTVQDGVEDSRADRRPFAELPHSKHDDEHGQCGKHWDETQRSQNWPVAKVCPLISAHDKAEPQCGHGADHESADQPRDRGPHVGT